MYIFPLYNLSSRCTFEVSIPETLQFYSSLLRSNNVWVKISDLTTQEKVYLVECFFSRGKVYSDAYPRCEFRSAARVGPSGHGWPYSGDQGLVTIVGPTVVFSVLPTLAANTGNQIFARKSAQLWPRLEPTVGPILSNCFRWPWQFSRPTSEPRLNQSSAY